MGLGTAHVIKTEVTGFIPAIWSDEVLASYKSNLVMANLVRMLNHRGKKGDTIYIPQPSRGSASTKSAETQVTLIEATTSLTSDNLTVTINTHKEYSRLIEDIVDIQAIESLRRFYIDDAGYALAKAVDLSLIAEAAATANSGTALTITGGVTTNTLGAAYIGDGTTLWDRSGAGNATDITDAGIRALIKRLDDVDAPAAGRYFVIPTVVKQDMLGFSRYTEQAFTGEVGRGNSIRNGLVGDVYGVEFYVTTQLPSVQDAGTGNDQKLALLFQRDALLLVEQAGVRTQTQYKQEYLADLFTADILYGVKTLRGTSTYAVVVPSVAS